MNSTDSNPYLEPLIKGMAISPIRFRQIVIGNVPDLFAHKYSTEIDDEDMFLTWFWKDLDQGVRCAVRFELTLSCNPQNFKITILRRRNRTTVDRDKPFAPVILDLRNLASILYGVDLFSSPSQSAWDFSNEIILLQQLAHAQAAVMQYGIPWIEDPRSNVAKIRRLMKERRLRHLRNQD